MAQEISTSLEGSEQALLGMSSTMLLYPSGTFNGADVGFRIRVAFDGPVLSPLYVKQSKRESVLLCFLLACFFAISHPSLSKLP